MIKARIVQNNKQKAMMSNMAMNIKQLNTLGAFVLGHATMVRRDHLLSRMTRMIPNDLVTDLRQSPILSPNLFNEAISEMPLKGHT